MKSIKLFASVMCLALLASSLFSCTEKTEIGEYDNWHERNTAYVDSIAKVCAKNADGQWAKICSYTLNDSVEALTPNNSHYIYIHKIEKGSGTYTPLYTDSVRVHYMGRLIPSAESPMGKVFDKSYASYVLNEETDVPTLMGVTNLVPGFATALQHMVEGDRWLVYIPSYLGYNTAEQASIPMYSTLVFDIKLARVYRYKIDSNTNWQ